MSGELTTSLPKGGDPGQVLTKVSYDNYKVDWKTPQQGGGAGGGWILPTGCIVLWSGSESNVPDGFALCNGQNGTPDLRDKFVLGSGAKYSVGDTGGAEEVTLTVAQMPSHNHKESLILEDSGTSSYPYWAYGTSGNLGGQVLPPGTSKRTDTGSGYNYSGSTGGGESVSIMPPYYTLAYIMKI